MSAWLYLYGLIRGIFKQKPLTIPALPIAEVWSPDGSYEGMLYTSFPRSICFTTGDTINLTLYETVVVRAMVINVITAVGAYTSPGRVVLVADSGDVRGSGWGYR